MHTWMTSQLNVALIRNLLGSLMGLACIDMLSSGVFTTRHWQTSGRLVQKLNACTADELAHQCCICNGWFHFAEVLNTLSHQYLESEIFWTKTKVSLYCQYLTYAFMGFQ